MPPLLPCYKSALLNLLLKSFVGSAGPVSVFREGQRRKRKGQKAGGRRKRGQYTQVAGRNMVRALGCRTCSEVECLGSAARRPGYLAPCALLITLVRKAT